MIHKPMEFPTHYLFLFNTRDMDVGSNEIKQDV